MYPSCQLGGGRGEGVIERGQSGKRDGEAQEGEIDRDDFAADRGRSSASSLSLCYCEDGQGK